MNKNYFIGFSTLLSSSIEKDVNFALKNGFNALSIDWGWNPKIELLDKETEILKDYASKGNKIVFHMPFFTPTNSSIPEISDAVKNYFKKAIVLAKRISAESITFHSGYVEQIADLKTHKYLIENIKEIIKFAKKFNIRLSIENDDMCWDYPLWKQDEIVDVLQNVDGINFTFDPGHANTAKIDVSDMFDKVEKYTDIVHLHNNHGKDTHNSLNEGDIDYKKLLSRMTQKKTIIFIFELFPHDKILKNREIFMGYLEKSK